MSRWLFAWVGLGLAVLVVPAAALPKAEGQEITFLEDFALAKDRAEALKQLIPGTEDYYYYHALHYQNLEQYAKVEPMLTAWIERHGRTARVIEIENRQALLTYAKNPDKTIEFLIHRLGLNFNHQRERLNEKPNLPVILSQDAISRSRLTERAFQAFPNLDGFEDSALDWLAKEDLNPERWRLLLQRISRPDHAGLAKLVVDDLNHQFSGGFGSHTIHRLLLLDQLEELVKLKGELLKETNFVNVYLSRLQPGPDVDWKREPAEQKAYLERLQKFVDRLAPVHNPLKAHVAYHRLDFDRSQGVYDPARFLAYLKLPRPAGYMKAAYLQLPANRDYPAHLGADFSAVTLFPPVNDDEPLVRDYLSRFFVKASDTKAYLPYVNDLYLKHLFAETKILAGLGEPEQWASQLPPDQFQALRSRIDLDFVASNKDYFSGGDSVAIEVDVKNVKTLLVKVFEINAFNYYRELEREPNTDINLDGLIANQELTFQYDESPLRRVRRKFEFPELSKPGVYAIDFIGNGKSSRVVLRKGKLHYLVRSSVAGQVFTILDENHQKAPKATLWLAGKEYTPEVNGEITVPYSNQPGQRAIILRAMGNGEQGEFCSLDHFQHEAESYALAAGIYVDREQLLSRTKATVGIRPSLTINGRPAPLAVLEEIVLDIASTDIDGVSSSKQVKDLKLSHDEETTYEFQVPARLATVSFVLRAKVKNLSQGQKIDVAASQSFTLNQIDTSEHVEEPHLAVMAEGKHVLELLGKTGEPRPDRPVQIALKHRDFREVANVVLQTDAAGRIDLGELKEIATLTVTTPEGLSRAWSLTSDGAVYPAAIHAAAGEKIELPYLGKLDKPDPSEVSLLEQRADGFLANHFDKLAIENGLLVISELPRGDYELLLKRDNVRIQLRVAAGEKTGGFVVNDRRYLQEPAAQPLQVGAIETGEKQIVVKLRNASSGVRVHVFATRWRPAYDPFDEMSRVRGGGLSMMEIQALAALYASGRNIGDEYRYILDRKYAQRLPGNQLDRPSMLLNPWAVRSTETSRQDAQAGDDFGAQPEDAMPPPMEAGPDSRVAGPAGRVDFSNLDFLSTQSAVSWNLAASEEGEVTIDRAGLLGRQEIHVVAVDGQETVWKRITIPESELSFYDLRLAKPLDINQHFTQQQKISLLATGEKFVVQDVASTRLEIYDTLGKVYQLYSTLSNNPSLAEFRFLLEWPKLAPEKRREYYSKFASHELNFFLAMKDPDFFASVVRAHNANKMDKTYLDEYLLGGELSPYLDAWKHSRLNVAERILLGRANEAQRPLAKRHIDDLYNLLPPDRARLEQLFETAIKGSALEAGDKLAFAMGEAVDKSEALYSQTFGAQPGASEGQRHASLQRAAGGFAQNAADDNIVAAGAVPASNAPEYSLAESQKELLLEHDESKQKLEKFSRSIRLQADNGVSGKKDRAYFDVERDLGRRSRVEQLFRQVDTTMEWAENNYYKLPIEAQGPELVQVNAFWKDLAAHVLEGDDTPFRSTHLAESSRTFPEMMFALGLLDLPFEAPEHATELADGKMTITAGGPLVLYHEEIKPVATADGAADGAADGKSGEKTPVLLSQNFFRRSDRYRFENNERLDKFVAEEFLTHVVYGCQIVATNPTSSQQRLDLLLQIPAGAMPVLGGKTTRNMRVDLGPFSTATVEYYFYFPGPGEFEHYPVQAAKNEQLVAFAEPFKFKVVKELSQIDRTSWDYVSQFADADDVLKFLREHNVQQLNLDKIAFRMADRGFFESALALLAERRAYNNTLWSYAVKHNEPPRIKEFLQYADGFVQQTGDYLDSELVVIDPVIRKTYQHLDYRPLINARAHALGQRRKILNDRFYNQYHALLKTLTYRPSLDDDEKMSVTAYMLLQDRVPEAIEFFGGVDADKLASRLQYDYFTAYLDFYSDDPQAAPAIAAKYADYPVDRWRNLFASVRSQLAELQGQAVELVVEDDRAQQQAVLAANEPTFTFKVENEKIALAYRNVKAVQVNYYKMDIELLFSRNPFVQEFAGQFSHIMPNAAETIELPADKQAFTIPLPESLHASNVLVEIRAAGKTQSQPYFANSLDLQLSENHGQLQVADTSAKSKENGEKSLKPLPKTYVKVYARMKDGEVKFYKDGYTDLRGKFDYASLSTNDLDNVDRFALLVLHDQQGAIVREASPPGR
jgi:hypothetical protein